MIRQNQLIYNKKLLDDTSGLYLVGNLEEDVKSL